MSETANRYLLPADSLIDNQGNIYKYSILPELSKKINDDLGRTLANQFMDENENTWDVDNTLDFLKRRSYEKFIDEGALRKEVILNEEPDTYFRVNKNANASDEMPLYEFHSLNQVNQFEPYIQKASQKYNIDADLIRAIIYMETTHGYYDIPIANLLKTLGLSSMQFSSNIHKSILPMNLNVDYWGNYFGTREQLLDPEYNIDTGTRFIANLSQHQKDYNIEKLASLYNNLAIHRVTNYGKRVAKFYREKPWKNNFDPYAFQSNDDWRHLVRGLLMTIIEKYPFLLK